jgi:hypothetical protein
MHSSSSKKNLFIVSFGLDPFLLKVASHQRWKKVKLDRSALLVAEWRKDRDESIAVSCVCFGFEVIVVAYLIELQFTAILPLCVFQQIMHFSGIL